MAKRKKGKSKLTNRQLLSREIEKEYKSKVAKLKKAGVFTSKVDARKKTTKYQRAIVRKFGDVLEEIVKVVLVKPEIRKQYEEEKTYRTRGRFVLLPADIKYTKTKEGYIKEHRGEYTILKLPFPITSMQQVVRRLKKDSTLDGLRRNNETFTFRINKHPARMEGMAVYQYERNEHMVGFATVADLAEYIELTYKHLFKKNKGNNELITSFELVAFREGRVPTGEEAVYDNRNRPGYELSADGSRMIRKKKRKTLASRERDRKKKAAIRSNESETTKKARLLADAERRRNRKMKE